MSRCKITTELDKIYTAIGVTAAQQDVEEPSIRQNQINMKQRLDALTFKMYGVTDLDDLNDDVLDPPPLVPDPDVTDSTYTLEQCETFIREIVPTDKWCGQLAGDWTATVSEHQKACNMYNGKVLYHTIGNMAFNCNFNNGKCGAGAATEGDALRAQSDACFDLIGKRFN